MNKIANELIEWGKALGFAFVVGAILIVFARPSPVVGQSMENTLIEGDVVLLEKVSYWLREPKFGDIIVVQSSKTFEGNQFIKLIYGSYKKVIKRVIGVPGDTIRIYDGNVYINDQLQMESYIKDGYTSKDGEWVIGERELFIMGDNRLASDDSRGTIGIVSYDKIIGRAYLRIYPFNRFGTLD